MENLKTSHPQKYWMKMICNYLYYMGLGDCWYEEREFSKFKKFYRIWVIIVNFYVFSIMADEILSHFRNDLTAKEKNDLIQITIAHPIIAAKITFLYLRRAQIKVILKKLLENNRDIFPSLNLDRDSVKKALMYFLATTSIIVLTMVSTTVDAVITHINEGIPIRVEITFFPKKSDSGIFVNFLRVIIEFHYWFIVSAMILIDGLSIFALTFIGFKFRRVRLYFESLRERFSEKLNREPDVAEHKRFWHDFITGIKLHEDALWCARSVQRALGVFYSIQVFESIGLQVICLIRFVTMERNFSLMVANLAFIIALVLMTGSYMMDAADITYEASMISTAMFHCGWEYVSPRAGHRTLVVMAIQRSQVPVYMTAFGIIILSYSNFITVLRSSYSFFAVMF